MSESDVLENSNLPFLCHTKTQFVSLTDPEKNNEAMSKTVAEQCPLSCYLEKEAACIMIPTGQLQSQQLLNRAGHIMC